MPKLRKAPLILICLALPLAAWSADFWVKKPYQTWSAEETRKILEESPWATTLTLGGVQAVSQNGPRSGGGVAKGTSGEMTRETSGSEISSSGELETNPSITYTMQFRSAPPIRQAQVRSSQIGAHYDKMNADQKAAFDANSSKFLGVNFPDRVIVAVTFHSNVQDYQSRLRTYWMDQSLGKESMKVFLNTGTERLSLTNYSYKDDTLQFTFPRPKDLPADGKISVEFVHPRIERIGEQRIFQVFSVKKMLIDGQPAL